MRSIVAIVLSFFSAAGLLAQEESATADSLRKDALNIYFTGHASAIVRQEIPYVNYVRDRKVADLIVIETSQGTGSGGREYIYYLEGKRKLEGVMDTIRYHAKKDEMMTDKVIDGRLKAMKMGLMEYLINTPIAEFIEIDFTAPLSDQVTTDQWNGWVFNTRMNGNFNGSQSSNSYGYSGHFDAGKTTTGWKFRIGGRYSKNVTEYDYGDLTAKNTKENSRMWVDYALGISRHFSVGMSADIHSSIYSNYDLQVTASPSLEYNLYPYSESTRRKLTLFYNIGISKNDYADTTQFFKTEETLGWHSIQAAYKIVERFGSISAHARWSNYLHDFSLNNTSLGFHMNIKIAKGLSFNVYGNYSFIHDQISLRKGEATTEDVLLHQQELSTTFSYHGGIGVSYSFGSIYSNAVNQRLERIF